MEKLTSFLEDCSNVWQVWEEKQPWTPSCSAPGEKQWVQYRQKVLFVRCTHPLCLSFPVSKNQSYILDNRVGEAGKGKKLNPNISTTKREKNSQHQAGAMVPWENNILITILNYFAVPHVQHQFRSNPCSPFIPPPFPYHSPLCGLSHSLLLSAAEGAALKGQGMLGV